MVARPHRPATEMEEMTPAVLRWPVSLEQAPELLIISVDAPQTQIRDTARQLVREVLREILGDIELVSIPGQPIRLARQDGHAGISVSHESGLSLLAVHFSGPVGIDLLKIPQSLDWQEDIPLLSNDYLGPEMARRIGDLPAHEQLLSFVQAWTEHEARLKCRGLGLEEWSAALEAHLSPCRVQRLALPAGYVGAVATLKAAENPGA